MRKMKKRMDDMPGSEEEQGLYYDYNPISRECATQSTDALKPITMNSPPEAQSILRSMGESGGKLCRRLDTLSSLDCHHN